MAFVGKTALFLPLLPLVSFGLFLLPNEINIPARLKNRSAEQIKTVFFSLQQQNQGKTANLWRLKYHKALLLKKKDTEAFCRIMRELGEHPVFPLKDLALIQSYELCPYPSPLVFEPDRFPPWLRLRLAEAFYKRRKVFEEPEQTLQATVYLARNSLYPDLRVSYLKHALTMARKAENNKVIQDLTLLLYKEAPRLNPSPEPKDYFALAEDLRQNRQFKKAIFFYTKLINTSSASFKEKDLSFRGLSQIYKIQKNRQQRIKNSRQWSQWLLSQNTEESLKKYYLRQLERARQEWNRDENQKAIQMVTKILEEPKSSPVSAEALYLRGMIYAQENEPILSLADWSRVGKKLAKKKGPSPLLEKILWKKAWLLKNQKDYIGALRHLRLLEKRTKNSYTLSRALFWRSYILWKLGQKTWAKKGFYRLIEKDYFGYYGLLAHKMLNKKPEFPSKVRELSKAGGELFSPVFENSGFPQRNKEGKLKQDEPKPSAVFSPDGERESLVHWLILFREDELLSHFLNAQKSQLFSQSQAIYKDWIKIIFLYTKAKKYLEAFRFLERMNEEEKAYFLRHHLYLLFPLDFAEEVQKTGRRWDISPAIIFALIRQESAFNTRARSLADAFGLMQLIPTTARQTARQIKEPYRGWRDLYKPSKNIMLGTAHFKVLLNRYDNSFIFAVAAYNAGGKSLDKWRESLKGLSALEFIENIPYEETRSYVRLLIRNYVFYHNYLGHEGPWFPDGIIP